MTKRYRERLDVVDAVDDRGRITPRSFDWRGQRYRVVSVLATGTRTRGGGSAPTGRHNASNARTCGGWRPATAPPDEASTSWYGRGSSGVWTAFGTDGGVAVVRAAAVVDHAVVARRP